MDKNELQDMEHSLNRALSTQENKRASPRRGSHASRRVTDAELKKGREAELASLNALAQDSYGGARNVSYGQHAKAASGENGDRHRVDPKLDEEIGGAFDAMFSPRWCPQRPTKRAAFKRTRCRMRLRRRLRNGLSGSEANKKPTRIFDISAMQQVQSEQDIASTGTNGHGRRIRPKKRRPSGTSRSMTSRSVP